MTWRPGVLQDGSGPDETRSGVTSVAALGVADTASAEDVEQVADRIVAFLATAPPEIDGWALRQRAEVERVAGAHAVDAVLGADSSAATDPPERARRQSRRRIPGALILGLLIPLLIWGVYRMGGGDTSTTQTGAVASTAANIQPLDEAKVAELEAAVDADPTDIDSMRELARMHLLAGDLDGAVSWQQRILADHPDDIDARLALGVALFNQGDLDAAETQWLRAVELDPSAPEPHYNLGFLYVASDPPRMDEAKTHWDTVVELAPDSDMATNIATHMGAVVDGMVPTDPATGEP